ncbi:hypothetical protein AAVH_23861 [Aphelenchoides avenae]|nr:hypothetical protein AAVH_23861 [Aphelenchus avenae]
MSATRPQTAPTHQYPVRASTPGMSGFLKNEPSAGSTSAQGPQGSTPVTRADVTGGLMTDRRSTPAEAQWHDCTLGNGSDEMFGLPDGVEHGGPLDDDEASLPDSTGHCSDAD